MPNKNPSYKVYNFNKVWKYFPLQRSYKEFLKTILFLCFPFYFKKWEIYNSWQYAQVYKKKGGAIWKHEYWERKLFKNYRLKISPGVELDFDQHKEKKLAVVIHVFYVDIFQEILSYLTVQDHIRMSLYLSGPGTVLKEVRPLIPNSIKDVQYFPTQNRGRDILPFLNVLPVVFKDGHDLVLKLHTKGSNHLNRKDFWRNDLFSKLLSGETMDKVLHVLHQNPLIGMIGPVGNILPMKLYYSANGQTVKSLSNRMGVLDNQLADLNFVAGSMFYCRKAAMLPILGLNLSENDFELEANQTDGTLAHSVERAFAAGLIASGFQLADTDYDPANPCLTVSKVNRHII